VSILRRGFVASATALALCACAGSGDDAGGASDTEAAGTTGPSTTTPAPDSAVARSCPPGYDTPPGAGEHLGFAAAGQQRSFHLRLPDDADGQPPLFVALTGTVQTEPAFLAQSQLDLLAEQGWMVVAPVRNSNGSIWPPWDDLRAPGDGDRPNPDVEFITQLVECLAAHYEADRARIFVGGISAGGSMTNRLLRERSDLFAGGVVGSGNFALTAPAAPEPLDDMTVIVAWGGESDRWIGCADGRMGAELAGAPGCVDVSFVADASAASQFYASEPNVRHVACSADVGHIWITAATDYWAQLLEDNPKGSTDPVDLREPPPELTCSTEPFVR
jgi:poly(3-hydroxybutyrate) depolymerase